MCIASKSRITLTKDPDAGRQVDFFDGVAPAVYTFSLAGPGAIKVRGDVPDGSWAPCFAARYGTGRGKSLGLKDVRVGIVPMGWVKSRTAEELVQANDTLTLNLDSGTGQLSLPFEKNESVVRSLIRSILKEG